MAIAASAQTDAPAATDALASLASKLFPSASFKLAQLNPTWPASFCPASIVMPSTRRSRKALYLTLPPAPTAINKRGAPHSDTTCGSPSATGCCRRRRRLCNVRPFTISLALPVIVARQRQSIRPSYFFVSAYPRRIFLCSAQSGRWLLGTRDQSDKATTRRGDDSKKRTMDGAGRIGSLPPSGWPGSLTTMFRFSAGRLPSSPPKPLDSSPRWVAPILVLRGSECCPWGQIVKMGGCRHRRHGRGGTARQKALVLLCSRLAAANTSTSRSVVLSSIFETQLHVFRSRIPHPQRALPHHGTPSTGTLCSVAWPTVDLPRSVLGSSAHSWCRARSLKVPEGRSLCTTPMPPIGEAAAERQRETRGGTSTP